MTGYKLSELQKLGACVVCGKKQLDGLPLFYVVEITRGGFDAQALRRAAGFEMALGPLAQVMGPDETLAQPIDGPHRVFVHETCANVGHLLNLFPKEAR